MGNPLKSRPTTPSLGFSSPSSPAHSPRPRPSTPFGDDFELASRRRAGAALRAGEYDSLPTFQEHSPNSSPPTTATTRLTRSSRSAFCLRPRMVASLLGFAVLVLLLLPAKNRQTARDVMEKVGVDIPDQLISDRLQDFYDSWKFGVDDGSRDMDYIPPDRPAPVGEDTGETELVTPFSFHQNGHFLVQPLSSFETPPTPHPILTLIKRAESQWNRKVARQSKTLVEAASEYRRRYTRNPPIGFDKWWLYAQANKIVLVDEYDQIHKDMEPFWALEPSDLLHRTDVMQDREETFTIEIFEGKVDIWGEQADLRRAIDLGDLMARFSMYVGDSNYTFTRHDQPACALGWYHKEKMVELAAMGEYSGPSDFFVGGDAKLSNWANGCPPDSELRSVEMAALSEPVTAGSTAKFKSHSPAYITDLSKERSYIFDHQAAMDICQHPEIMPIHGFTTAPGTDAGPLVPLFTFAKTTVHSDVLVTPLEQYSDTYIGYDPEWRKKKHDKILWRGSTTGANFDAHSDWRASQRSRLHFLSHEKKGSKNILMTDGAEGAIKEETVDLGRMNEAYMDTSFSGGPVQCDKKTCDLLSKVIDFAPTMGLDESYQYKYMLDVDGNGWSGRFHKLMSTKSMVLKSTLFPEWYSDRIQPWVHYVPVKIDYADLYDIMTFFRGTPDGNSGHDDLAEKIGTAGKMWARDHWRKQDMAAYMFRLTLEWSRLLHRGEDGTQDYLG